MKTTKNRYIGLVLTSTVLTSVLSACSGGGSGGGDSSAATPAAPAAKPVAVTPANASKVSAEAYFGVVDVADFGANGFGRTTISAAVVSSNAANFDLYKFIQRIAATLPEPGSSYQGDMLSGVVIPAETVECERAGSFTITAEVADPQMLSAGDTVTVALANCDDAAGVLNGDISMRYISIDRNSADEVIGLNAALTMADFSVTFSGQTWTSNGDVTLASSTPSDVEANYALSGTAFTVTRDNKASTLRNFSIDESYNVAVDATVTETNGTLVSAAIGGSVSFATTQAFQRLGNDYPFEGAAMISGANGSSTMLVAIDSVNVRLDIDADGDNSVEESIATTWAELNQLQ